MYFFDALEGKKPIKDLKRKSFNESIIRSLGVEEGSQEEIWGELQNLLMKFSGVGIQFTGLGGKYQELEKKNQFLEGTIQKNENLFQEKKEELTKQKLKLEL